NCYKSKMLLIVFLLFLSKYKSTCAKTQVLRAPGGAKDIGSSISVGIITQILAAGNGDCCFIGAAASKTNP
ncbi:hypothetical protein, partial [Phascolarctobacterium faecium]|uniref:hypothetical protein n=1 Tax=Phascolarctobacterium faecium TaxID=33025 RepID=UPI003AB66676